MEKTVWTKIIIAFLFILSSVCIYGQEQTVFYIEGKTVINAGDTLYINGNLVADDAAYFDNRFEVVITDSIINQGTEDPLFEASSFGRFSNVNAQDDTLLEPRLGKVNFMGLDHQIITSESTTLFNQIRIAKDSNVVIENDINALGEIYFEGGNLNLNGHNLILHYTKPRIDERRTGALITESNNSRVIDTIPMDSTLAINRLGYVEAKKVIAGTEDTKLNNIGLMSYSTQGPVTFRRFHFSDTMVTGGSIKKLYQLIETDNFGENINQTIKYLNSDCDLSNNEDSLMIWYYSPTETGYNTNYPGVSNIYFPSKPNIAIDTIDNLVHGIVTLKEDYIYTAAPLNCDDLPTTSLEDSMDVCARGTIELAPFEGTDYDYRDYFYRWTAPDIISQTSINNAPADSSVYEYSFTADDSIVGRSFPIYVEIRDVKGCHTTDSVIITVRDNSMPILKMFSPDSSNINFAICAGDSFYIQDSLNKGIESTSYTWCFNSDTLYNQSSHVDYSLETAGINKFWVQYINEYGCIAKKPVQDILVYPFPEALLSGKGFCQGTMSTITNSTSIPDVGLNSAIRSYSWEIGDIDSIYVGSKQPQSSTGSTFEAESVTTLNQNPDLSFLFENAGDVELILTTTSRFGCISSDTSHFYINPSVVAQFDTSALTNVCNGTPSAFFPGDSCSTGADINYRWTFLDTRPSKTTDTASFIFNGSKNYEVELMVMSDSGCSDTSFMDVTIHPNAIADFTVENHCLDTSRITLFGNRSTDANTYMWNYGNGTSDTIGSVIYDSAGLYTVNLQANNRWNCANETNHVIEIYPLPDVNFTAKSSACINAQYNLFENTSQGAKSYKWTFGDQTTSTDENPDKKYNVTGERPVTLIGTSEFGCINSSTKSILIHEIIEADFSPASASVCQGLNSLFEPSSSLSGFSGITWSFGDGNSQFVTNANPSINYIYAEAGAFEASMITLSDSGCTDTASAIVTIAAYPQITIETEGQECENSEIVFSLSDNSSIEEIVSYQWNFGEPANPENNFSISPTASHFYGTQGTFTSVLSVVSNRGCRAYDTLLVNIDSLPQILFGEEPIGTCESSLELIAGANNLDYLWSDGSNLSSLLVTSDGYYSVTATNPVSGCSSWRETFVELSTEVNPGLADALEVCDSIAVDAHNPGGTYLWSTGATSRFLNINTSGTYWVEVTDINGCVGYDTIDATIHNSPDISLPEVVLACDGSNVMLDPGTAAGNFEWNTGSTNQVLEVNTPGYYWVKISDVNNCTDIALSNVIFNPVPIVYLGADRNICEDKLATLSAGNPDCNYSWSSGETTQAITPISSGYYSVDVTNSYGCTGSDSVQVQINALPVINLGGDQSLCENDKLILDAGIPADVYYWSTNEFTRSIEINKPGTYWVRVTDSNACTAVSEMVNVNYRSIPEAPFTLFEQEACNFMLLDAGNAGSSYAWNDGNTGRNYLAESTGIYWVDITNSLGCSLRDSVDLTIKPMAILSLDHEMEICSNGSGIIDAGYFGEDYTYSWNTGSTEQFTRVSSEGKYKVDVIHVDGCVASDSVYVSTVAAPQVDLGADMFLCLNSGLTLDAGNPGGVYFWGSTSGINYSEQVIPVLDTGMYWVYTIAPNGCAGSDSVEILYTNQSIEPLFMCASHIRVGDTVRFVDLSVPEPSTYYWDFGDMVASTESEPTHVYLTEESFDARLTVTNEVCSATIQKPLLVEGFNPGYLIKLAEENLKPIPGFIHINKAKIYPNPTTDYINLSLEISEQSNIGLYLYGINGQMLKMEKLNGIQVVEHTINISGLREGMYFLRVVTRNEAKTFKILKY